MVRNRKKRICSVERAGSLDNKIRMSSFKSKIEQAEDLFRSGKYADSEFMCRKILKNKSKNFFALHLLGLSQGKQGKLNQAISTLESARAINRIDAELYSNLGNYYLEAGRVTDAIKSCKTSIQLEKTNANAYHNLGTALLTANRLDESEQAYRQSLKLNPNNSQTTDHLGVCLTKQGRLLEGANKFLQANELDPALTSVYIHLFNTLMFMHNTEDAERVVGIGLDGGLLQPGEELELLIGKAKISWLTGQLSVAREAIDKSRDIHLKHLNYHNVANLRRYHRCLDLLLAERVKFSELYEGKPEQALFFVADSHCLSPSETIIKYRNQLYRVLSALITGCKAWHLSMEKRNEYKASLATLFKAIPNGTPVVLGIGEIDCRFDHGILPAYCNKGIDFRLSIPSIVERYVDYSLEQADRNQHTLILYGVPAPASKVLEKIDPQKAKLLCEIIQYFNEVLRTKCALRELDFLDVYAATKNKWGQSNMEYHIDKNHIHPRIMPILFKSFLITGKV